MIPSPDTREEDIDKLLLEDEIADLESYCKAQGFTQEETDTFVQNTLRWEREHEEAELRRMLGE